jgi:hypothetical protein
MMVAVLPRQAVDDLGGELFVEAYRRQLGEYPTDAISYLADEAMRRCKWFPTIAECHEIISGWRRWDADTLRRATAINLYHAELDARRPRQVEEEWRPTAEELDAIKASVAARFPSQRGD